MNRLIYEKWHFSRPKLVTSYLDLENAFERFQYQPRALIDLVFLFVSGADTSFAEALDAKIEASLNSDLFQPVLDAMTALQKQICRRLTAGGDVSSMDARKFYSEALARPNISPGSISDAA